MKASEGIPLGTELLLQSGTSGGAGKMLPIVLEASVLRLQRVFAISSLQSRALPELFLSVCSYLFSVVFMGQTSV